MQEADLIELIITANHLLLGEHLNLKRKSFCIAKNKLHKLYLNYLLPAHFNIKVFVSTFVEEQTNLFNNDYKP